MKIYFDTLDDNESNLKEHQQTANTDYWLIAPGAPIKKTIKSMSLDIGLLSEHNENGIYYLDVRGDPQWWAGVLEGRDVPTIHVLECLPQSTLDLVRNKKLRIIIAADREGGPMTSRHWDCFKSTTDAVRKLQLPVNSVIIIQGNKKIEQQYASWLDTNNEQRLFDVMYGNHFSRIFFDNYIPRHPVIREAMANPNSKDFNSLNRVYRPQRGAHLYRCIKDGILNKGLVSGNQIQMQDPETKWLCGEDYSILRKHFPKFIDGNWSETNAANQYNVDIYKNSLISVITETMFIPDVAFITEKIFKPITLGHPLILFASQGTLKCLQELGFKTDWCGIDPSYNDIEDPVERFNATQKVLVDWVNLSEVEKISRLEQSLETIIYNQQLILSRDFYKEAITETVKRSEEYFNETV